MIRAAKKERPAWEAQHARTPPPQRTLAFSPSVCSSCRARRRTSRAELRCTWARMRFTGLRILFTCSHTVQYCSVRPAIRISRWCLVERRAENLKASASVAHVFWSTALTESHYWFEASSLAAKDWLSWVRTLPSSASPYVRHANRGACLETGSAHASSAAPYSSPGRTEWLRTAVPIFWPVYGSGP